MLDWLISNRLNMKVFIGVHGARSALRTSGLLGAMVKSNTRFALCPVLMIFFIKRTFTAGADSNATRRS